MTLRLVITLVSDGDAKGKGDVGDMGAGRSQRRPLRLLQGPRRAEHSALRRLDTGRPQHRAPPLMHSPPHRHGAADRPLGLVLRVMEGGLAPRHPAVPPLHRSSHAPILRNGSQGVGAFRRASRQRFNPTGPGRLPAAWRM